MVLHLTPEDKMRVCSLKNLPTDLPIRIEEAAGMKVQPDLQGNTMHLLAGVHRGQVLRKARRQKKILPTVDLPVLEVVEAQKPQNPDLHDLLNQDRAEVQGVVMIPLLPEVRHQVLPTVHTIREAAEAVLPEVATNLPLPEVHPPDLLQDLHPEAADPVAVVVVHEEAAANSLTISSHYKRREEN